MPLQYTCLARYYVSLERYRHMVECSKVVPIWRKVTSLRKMSHFSLWDDQMFFDATFYFLPKLKSFSRCPLVYSSLNEVPFVLNNLLTFRYCVGYKEKKDIKLFIQYTPILHVKQLELIWELLILEFVMSVAETLESWGRDFTRNLPFKREPPGPKFMRVSVNFKTILWSISPFRFKISLNILN